MIRFLKTLAIFIVFVGAWFLFASPVLASKYTISARKEATWIMSAQKDSGVVTLTPHSAHIIPYYSNLALKSVVKVSPKYQAGVKKYLDWYFLHYNKTPDNLGVAGTIYDFYRLESGEEVPLFEYDPEEKNYDSSDAYAATFLSLVWNYYQYYGDEEYIRSHLADLKIISSAIDATLQKDWLTWAKPDYHTQYLMDNVEVWRGWHDFSNLLKSLGDSDASVVRRKANKVRAAINKHLYDKKKRQYRPYHGGKMSWQKFYPDAQANLWPIVFNLPEGKKRTKILWDKFIKNQPAWLILEAIDSPKASGAYAAALAGDIKSLKIYYKSIRNEYSADHQWPWKISESGWYIESLLELENRSKK